MEAFADLSRADYLHRRRIRRLKNFAGFALSAATIALVYLLGIGSG